MVQEICNYLVLLRSQNDQKNAKSGVAQLGRWLYILSFQIMELSTIQETVGINGWSGRQQTHEKRQMQKQIFKTDSSKATGLLSYGY